MRLVAAGVLPPMLDGLLITHLHSDHITDLGDVITTRWVMSPVARPLTVVRSRLGSALSWTTPSPRSRPMCATGSITTRTSPRAPR